MTGELDGFKYYLFLMQVVDLLARENELGKFLKDGGFLRFQKLGDTERIQHLNAVLKELNERAHNLNNLIRDIDVRGILQGADELNIYCTLIDRYLDGNIRYEELMIRLSRLIGDRKIEGLKPK